MNNTIFKILSVILVSLFITSCSKADELKEGDIIFHTSQSKQAPLIAYATMSNKTHCGIIVEKDSKLYVLETLGTIKLTPLNNFIDRGLFKHYWVKRGINKPIDYKKYLGIPYDLSFKPDNSRYYCSELVYTIYKEQFGVELCAMRQIKDYNIFGIAKTMKARGMDVNQYVVAPSDLFNSPKLTGI